MSRLRTTVLPVLVLVSVLLATAQQARATILAAVPLEEQAATAELVVLAVAGEQSCSWGDGQKIIYTDTHFRVERWIKGEGGDEVISRRMGGVIGDIGQSVAGSPEFKTGRRYVLFLESAGAGRYRVVGFSQGAYPVVRTIWGKSKVMPSLASAGGAEMVGVADGGAVAAQPLEQFIERVKEILGEGGGK